MFFAGTREGANDVEILGAHVDSAGKVSGLHSILDRHVLSRQMKRKIRKLGNPVLYSQGKRLWLFVVSVSYGAVLPALFGAVLYATELDFIHTDVYRTGFSSTVALLATSACICLLPLFEAFIATQAFAAFQYGLYPNYYDAILDFPLWIVLTVFLLLLICRKLRPSAEPASQLFRRKSKAKTGAKE